MGVDDVNRPGLPRANRETTTVGVPSEVEGATWDGDFSGEFALLGVPEPEPLVVAGAGGEDVALGRGPGQGVDRAGVAFTGAEGTIPRETLAFN